MANPVHADILFVEDNPFDITLTMRVLAQLQLAERVQVVNDGREALDYIFGIGAYSSRRAEDLPRLVLLDLKLPKVNGIQVLQWIRADLRTKEVPVVVLTSFEDDRKVVEVYKLGVSGYLMKPLEKKDFLPILERLNLGQGPKTPKTAQG
jgi:CheY-like chemotaxis protein